MSEARANQLRERIILLNSYKLVEERNPQKSDKYIEDLKLSIAGCESELKFHLRNPTGVFHINGA